MDRDFKFFKYYLKDVMSKSSVIDGILINIVKLGFLGNVQKSLQLLQLFNLPHLAGQGIVRGVEPMI